MMIQASDLHMMLQAISDKISANKALLDSLDAALGDGDHGTGISTGFIAAVDATKDAATPADIMKRAGMQLMNRVGGTSGAIFGTLFFKAATVLPAAPEITAQQFAEMWQAGCDGVMQRGKAEIGDKTMLDALLPATQTLKQHIDDNQSLSDALKAAHAAAVTGAESTIEMQAKHGRAKYIGERAIGHMDAGSQSIAFMFEAMLTTIGSINHGET